VSYTVTDQDGADSSQNVKMVVTAAADTVAPSLTSSSSLSAANIGSISSHTLTFDESVTSFSLGSLPTGMSITVS